MSKSAAIVHMKLLGAVLLASLFLAGCHGHLHNGNVPPGQVKKVVY
jgi:outer membrane murein-binding lipoprotein Lpp